MNKRNKNIKNLALLSCMLVVINMLNMPLNVYAYGKNEDKRPLNQYLEYEYQNNTGCINKEKEKELNKWGVYDEEIKQFDKETIEYVENSEIIFVQSEYIKVNEEGESVVMTEDEVDAFILDHYQDKVDDKTGKLDYLLEKIGLIPITVHAASNENLSASGCFKKNVIVTQVKKGTYKAHVTITFTWLTEPKYRMEDTVFVYFEGADIIPNSNSSCKYYYTTYTRWRRSASDSWTYLSPKTTESVNYTSFMKAYWMVDVNSGSYAYAIIDLKKDLIFSDDGTSETKYINHKIIMQMDIKKDESHNLSYFMPQIKYFHQQNRDYSIKPSISISSAGSISFAGALASTEQNHPMGDVLTLRYDWK